MQVYKKATLVFAFSLCVLEVNAQQGFMAGFGPTYEINNSNIGVNGRFFYGPTETFCFGPEVSYFPFQDIDDEYQASVLDLNVNAHYIFEINHKVGVYPLSGLNYTIEKERLIDASETETEAEKEFGLNYGIGAHYNLGETFAFLEFKGVAGQLNDEFITLGVIFRLFNKEE